MVGAVSVNEGDRLKLTCRVGGFDGLLSVSWQRKIPPVAGFSTVVGLNQEGVPEELLKGAVAARPAADTFTLELEEVTAEDSGVYQCTVSELKTNSMTGRTSRTQAANVTVVPVGEQ